MGNNGQRKKFKTIHQILAISQKNTRYRPSFMKGEQKVVWWHSWWPWV